MNADAEADLNQGGEKLLNRRALLQAGAGAALLGVLAGCQSSALKTPSSQVMVSPSPTPPSSPSPIPTIAPTSGVVPFIEPGLDANYLQMVDSSTHVIFDLCIRDGACVEVCPVECIVPGYPVEEWPWYYVDPETCIACGACVPECPVAAVLPAVDLQPEYRSAIEKNALFFTDGPGYSALSMG